MKLHNLSPLNQHLHPCCLVLQKYVPGESGALSFFVTKKGRPIWIAGVVQSFDNANLFVGGVIFYPNQQRLRGKYGVVVDQITDTCMVEDTTASAARMS